MNFARALFNIVLITLGGVLGNLLAAWLQQDVWRNTYTWPRVLGTLAGLAAVLLLLAWLDRKGQAAGAQAPSSSPAIPPGVHRNVQIGNPVMRLLTGTNAYGNIQIGSGRIEVVERSSAPPVGPQPSKRPDPGSLQARQRQQLEARRQQLSTEQEQLTQKIRRAQIDLQRTVNHDPNDVMRKRYDDLVTQRDQVAAQLVQLNAILDHPDL